MTAMTSVSPQAANAAMISRICTCRGVSPEEARIMFHDLQLKITPDLIAFGLSDSEIAEVWNGSKPCTIEDIHADIDRIVAEYRSGV